MSVGHRDLELTESRRLPQLAVQPGLARGEDRPRRAPHQLRCRVPFVLDDERAQTFRVSARCSHEQADEQDPGLPEQTPGRSSPKSGRSRERRGASSASAPKSSRDPSLRSAQISPAAPRYSVDVPSWRSPSSSRGWVGHAPSARAASASATIAAIPASARAGSHSASVSGSCARRGRRPPPSHTVRTIFPLACVVPR